MLDESVSGDLDEPGSTCGGRKRIFSQSDVDFNQITERKKINPFSSALSAAPYYFHDFKNGNNQTQNQRHITAGHQAPHLTIDELTSDAEPFVPQFRQIKPVVVVDVQSNSSFGGCGLPNFSETLTLNDGVTAVGNEVSKWNRQAAEFVPKGLNQLAAQGQLPSQLSQLPVNATADTAFLKFSFRHQNNN